jgi:hypothetical protein
MLWPYQDSIIRFKLYDYDHLKSNDDLGDCYLNIKNLNKGEEYKFNLEVIYNNKAHGTLYLKIIILNLTAKQHFEENKEKYKEYKLKILKENKDKTAKKSLKVLILGIKKLIIRNCNSKLKI